MLEYLDYSVDLNDPDTVSVLDELPLWSAPFGLMLLDMVSMKPGITVLDIGFGTGFPLLELARRLGDSCTVYGIDPWKEAINRTQRKMKMYDINNVKLVEGDAAAMDFPDDTFDLIVSNTGFNNFENPAKILEECYRVAKPNGKLAFTTNPVGHMEEFYRIYRETLKELELNHLLDHLAAQEKHRLSIQTMTYMLQNAGFQSILTHQRNYTMRFLNGTAFFNHYLIRVGFLEGWKSFIPPDHLKEVFTRLEENLNIEAQKNDELRMTIPVFYVEGEKV
ncbi:MAG: class I SAM-dependent methyltransferase [bacterium]|nr:class I SAM-dependent methyltransferase [bacterium]